MTNKPMLSEREKFEAFWRSTMNVQDMDLHRCEFPMTAYDDQPYACQETERGRMTWMARAKLDHTLTFINCTAEFADQACVVQPGDELVIINSTDEASRND